MTYATREEYLGAFAERAKEPFAERAKLDIPAVRISVGFPSRGARSKAVGECWSAKASADGVAEIFLRPSLQSDIARVCDILTHELIHACLPTAGHGPAFRAAATALGLQGKMTATVAGDGWREWAMPIIESLGQFPGASLSESIAAKVGGRKKQETYYRLLRCTTCDWQARVTDRYIEGRVLHCPTGCGGRLNRAS